MYRNLAFKSRSKIGLRIMKTRLSVAVRVGWTPNSHLPSLDLFLCAGGGEVDAKLLSSQIVVVNFTGHRRLTQYSKFLYVSMILLLQRDYISNKNLMPNAFIAGTIT